MQAYKIDYQKCNKSSNETQLYPYLLLKRIKFFSHFLCIIIMENKIKRESLKTYNLIFENPTLIFSESFHYTYDYRLRIIINHYQAESTQLPRQSQNSCLTWDQVFIFQQIIGTSNSVKTEIEILQKNSSSDSILKFQKNLNLQQYHHEIKFARENYQGKIAFNLIKFEDRLDLKKYKSPSSRTFAKIHEKVSKQLLTNSEFNDSLQTFPLNEYSTQSNNQNKLKQQNGLLIKPTSGINIQQIVQKQIATITSKISKFEDQTQQLIRQQIQEIIKSQINIINQSIQKKLLLKEFLKSDQQPSPVISPQHQKFSIQVDKENIFDLQPYKSQDHKIKIKKRIKIQAHNKDFHVVYGDKIYQNQNAITMQKSILSYSLSKAPRFQQIKYDGIQPSYYVGTSFKFDKNLGTSFGFGKRKPYPDWMVKNMTEIPAPNTYMQNNLKSNILNQSKGFTFGIPYSYYKKVRLNYTEQQHGTMKSSLSNVKSLKVFNKQKSIQTLSSFSKTPENHYHYKIISSTK